MTTTTHDMTSRFAPAGLSQGDADRIAELLQDRLHSLLDLTLVLKHAHWNVVGPGFMAVHELLDKNVVGVRAMADAVAERIATVGAIPNGLAGHLVEARDWDDYAIGRAAVPAHLAALRLVYDGVIGDHRKALSEMEKLDPVTADLLTQQLGELELQQWFIVAHLKTVDGELVSGGETTELGAAAAAATSDQ